MTKPKVSIIMPVLNGERYIGQAIASIVEQTFRNYELIVVDDGSTDGTAQCVQRFANKLELKYIRHTQNQGIGRSVNDGIRHAAGEFIAFLDHDDIWLPVFLETQLAYLRQHPEVAMVHSDFQTVDGEGNILEDSVSSARGRIEPSGHIFRELFLHSLVCGNTVLIRKECFEQLGTFDENLRYGDYHMWMRIGRHHRIDYTPKVLTQYRQHRTQQTRSSPLPGPAEDSVELQAIKSIITAYPEIRQELGAKTVDRRISTLYFKMAFASFESNSFGNARAFLLPAIKLWPTNVRYLLLLAATLLPPSYAKALGQAKRQIRVMFSTPRGGAKPIWRRTVLDSGEKK